MKEENDHQKHVFVSNCLFINKWTHKLVAKKRILTS